MMKKVLSKLLLCIPFAGLWYCIGLLIIMAYHEGALSIYKDAFGLLCAYIGIGCLVLSATSIIYLRIWFKREKHIQIIAYSLTIVFLIGAIITANIGEKEFLEFSTQKWIDFPERRLTMYDDFLRKYDIKGMSESDVEALLGTPNEISEKNCYVYDCHFGNEVYIYFEDGIATSINYSE